MTVEDLISSIRQGLEITVHIRDNNRSVCTVQFTTSSNYIDIISNISDREVLDWFPDGDSSITINIQKY